MKSCSILSKNEGELLGDATLYKHINGALQYRIL